MPRAIVEATAFRRLVQNMASIAQLMIKT